VSGNEIQATVGNTKNQTKIVKVEMLKVVKRKRRPETMAAIPMQQ